MGKAQRFKLLDESGDFLRLLVHVAAHLLADGFQIFQRRSFEVVLQLEPARRG